jgi:hypothetical protein
VRFEDAVINDNIQRISDLTEQLALAELTVATIKRTTLDVIRAAEDAAYENAAQRIEQYALARLSGVAHSTAIVDAMQVRLLKSQSGDARYGGLCDPTHCEDCADQSKRSLRGAGSHNA